jgi:calcineurin-like phosphoesterase
MCGPENSILGVKSEIIIEKFRYHMPKKFEYAIGDISAQGAIFTLEGKRVVKVEAVRF